MSLLQLARLLKPGENEFEQGSPATQPKACRRSGSNLGQTGVVYVRRMRLWRLPVAPRVSRCTDT